jgi:hypothetical protein
MKLYYKIFSYKKPILIGFLIILGIIILIPVLCIILNCFSWPSGAYKTYCQERVIDTLCLSKIFTFYYNTSCFKECLFHPFSGIGEWISQFN